MNAPLVSVIVPFFGVQYYLANCIESILCQELANIEIVLVDDCSEDESLLIADYYCRQDCRVRVVRHDVNLGLGPARNTGVNHARGDFIFFLDSDDMLAWPGALRRLLSAALENDSCVTIGAAGALGAAGEKLEWDYRFERSYQDRVVPTLSGMSAYRALIRMPGAYYLPLRSWGCLIDRAFYLSINLDHPAGVHEDIGHNALMVSAADSVSYCRDIIVHYTQRQGSISKSRWSLSTAESYRDVWEHFREGHKRFGLSSMIGNASLHVFRNACWMLDRNGLVHGEEADVINVLFDIIRDASLDRDPEMQLRVGEIMCRTFEVLKMPLQMISEGMTYLQGSQRVPVARLMVGIR